MVIFPAELTTRKERTRHGRKICARHQFGRAARVIFPGEVTMYAEKIPTTAQKLGRVPRWQSGHGQIPGRIGRSAGKKTPRALNTRTKCRLGTVADGICPNALFHLGGSQTNRGDMIQRPCLLGRVTLVSEKETPTMAEKSDERTRLLAHLGYVSGGMGRPEEGRLSCAKHSNQVPSWGRRPRYVPGGIFHPDGTQTSAGEIIARRCRPGGIAFVISPPASTSRADESNAGEELGRSVTSVAGPSRFLPAEFTEGVAMVISPAESTTHDAGTRHGRKI